jgi:hypothetical protein
VCRVGFRMGHVFGKKKKKEEKEKKKEKHPRMGERA